MAKITLHKEKDGSATFVENAFIDHYMACADGEYVKIYLYLLRCMGAPEPGFSISKAADRFDHTERYVQRALQYWEKMKLLRLEYDKEEKIFAIRFLNAQGQEEKAPTQEDSAASSPEKAHASSKKVIAPFPKEEIQFTAEELSSFQDKANVRELLFVTEQYLKRTLTSTDLEKILYWHEGLQLSSDLIEYLIEYCVGNNHTSLYYMNKVALAWKEEGISTVEQAKRNSSDFNRLHFGVMRELGISNRNLTSAETTQIDKWNKHYGFSQDLILEACRRTILTTHQPSFHYTDKILEDWHKRQAKSLEDVAKLDEAFKKSKLTVQKKKAQAPNKFNNFHQRIYDFDQLEQQLLSN